jgi:ribonuclease R
VIPHPPKKKTAAPFPTREQIIEFLKENPDAGRRQIVRAFNITGDERIQLKILLKQMDRDGQIEGGLSRTEPLAAVAVIQVRSLTLDGEPIAEPVGWSRNEPPPKIFIADNGKIGAVGLGDRILAKLEREGRDYLAFPIRRLTFSPQTVVGVFEKTPTGGFIKPADKRDREEYRVARADVGDARSGELVKAELIPQRGTGEKRVQITERLGIFGEPRTFSLAAIAAADIPLDQPEGAQKEAEAAKPETLGDRADLRTIPLVTIDGSDARDFDDAVFAEADTDPDNKGGWHLLVAIADVSHYVLPGSALDVSARDRGNSVYFPDRVVPMLPEALSNDLCSLRPHEDRACLAVHIWIDAKGRKLSHRFVRGLMRSTARLTYEQVQAAMDGHAEELTAPLLEPVIQPLYGAFKALLAARNERGTLDLDLPERVVSVDQETGAVLSISPRARLDSHKLIEEFMVLANVCAAESLEQAQQPCVYRIHDQPSMEKLTALRDFLKTLELPLAKGQVLMPKHFSALLDKAANTPYTQMVSQMVLRSQAQACYSVENIGHFGLALRRYAHFTSPIRRYADLLVHRALIRGLHLPGQGALPEGQDAEALEKICDHITMTERRAAAAEREVQDRYTAAYLAGRQGEIFPGRITGVTRFGLFVQLQETGADGLIPIRTLPSDFYHHDEKAHALVGDRTHRIFRLGETLSVQLVDADLVTGGVVLALVEGEGPAEGQPLPGSPARKPARGRPPGLKPAAARPARRGGAPETRKKRRT